MFGKRIALVFLPLFLLSLFTACSSSDKIDNLFSYAVKIEDDIIRPRQSDFFITKEELFETTGMTEDTVTERDNCIFGNYIRVSDVSDKVRESYVLEQNRVITYRWVAQIDTADAEKAVEALMKQAKEAMPKELEVYTPFKVETVSQGRWQDEAGNWLKFDTSLPDDDGLVLMTLSLYVSRQALIDSDLFDFDKE